MLVFSWWQQWDRQLLFVWTSFREWCTHLFSKLVFAQIFASWRTCGAVLAVL